MAYKAGPLGGQVVMRPDPTLVYSSGAQLIRSVVRPLMSKGACVTTLMEGFVLLTAPPIHHYCNYRSGVSLRDYLERAVAVYTQRRDSYCFSTG